MKTRNRKGLVFFWIVCKVIAFSLLFSPTLPVRAQQPGMDTLFHSPWSSLQLEGRL